MSNTLSSTAEPRVSVVVPTFNEARNLPIVFSLMPDVHEVIVVDGRSTDDTIEVAKRLRPDVKIVLQTRRGKGNALACGFAAVTGDIVVMLDADGSADPREIPRFVRTLVEGADFAKGTRFAVGGGSSDITRIRRLGNKMLNGLVNLTYGTHYSDLCYGYNAFWARCLPVFALEVGEPGEEMLWGDGFEVETLINVRSAVAGLRVVEVPSFEADRIHGDSNLNAVSDGLRVLRTIAAERRYARTTGAQHALDALAEEAAQLAVEAERSDSPAAEVIDLASHQHEDGKVRSRAIAS
jgi:glycosyltransferase involved in cell wall biosynthesis